MTDLIKIELEEFRKASMLYWHVVGEDLLAEDTGTASDERLLLEAIITAKEKMKDDTREYKEYKRRQENEQN